MIYEEEDVPLSVLTPNTLIHGISIVNLEEASDNIDEYELRKRSRYIQKSVEKALAAWKSEYLKALREQHYLKHKSHDIQISNGDVALKSTRRKMKYRNSSAYQKREREILV